MDKGREFWLRFRRPFESMRVEGFCNKEIPDSVHTIEMSAYTKLKSERDAVVEALKYYASEDTWIKKEFKVSGEFSQWWDRLPNDKSIVPYKIGDATGNFNVLGAKARAVLAMIDKGEK